MKAPSPAQLAARKRFAEMARSGAFKKATKRKANPTPSQVPQIILQQLGGSKFIAMTGAKEFIGGSEFLGFKIPKNRSSANRVTIKYFPAKDLYEIDFIKSERYGLNTKIVKSFDNVYADQLRDIFTSVTGMETSLGTLGRKANPISGSNAGEFAMTVNGKTVHRFFIHTSDPWAKSHGFDYQLVSNVTKNGAFVKFTKTRAIVAIDEAADGSPVTEKWEIRNLIFYKTNPAKKTVSQKISQLVHEGYPQRQAVAVALSEQRAGKVKRNPMEGEQHLFGNKYATIRKDADGRFVAQIYEKVKTGIGEEIDFWGVKYYKTHAGAQRYLDSLKPMQKNPQKRNPRSAKPKKYYQVSIMQEGLHKTWMPIALFLTFAEAENYSHHLAKQHKNWTIRVHDTRAM